MADGKRVVLVKPGDLLLIGNLGRLLDGPQAVERMGEFFRKHDIKVCVFEDDIDLDVLEERDLL